MTFIESRENFEAVHLLLPNQSIWCVQAQHCKFWSTKYAWALAITSQNMSFTFLKSDMNFSHAETVSMDSWRADFVMHSVTGCDNPYWRIYKTHISSPWASESPNKFESTHSMSFSNSTTGALSIRYNQEAIFNISQNWDQCVCWLLLFDSSAQ
jgi:hypothetical protein